MIKGKASGSVTDINDEYSIALRNSLQYKFILLKFLTLKNKVMRKIFTTLISIIFILNCYSQVKITGTVTNNNGESLPGVTVLAKGTTSGAITDLSGKYTITIPNYATALIFSFIGMQTKEVTIGAQTVIDVILYSVYENKNNKTKKPSGNFKFSNFIKSKNAEYLGKYLPENSVNKGHRTLYFGDEYFNGMAINYGFHTSTFLNSQFGYYLENKNLIRKYGNCLSYSVIYYPIIADINFFSSRFKPSEIPNWNYIEEGSMIKHRGTEITFRFAIPPSIFTTYIVPVPYIGIGYSMSNLVILSQTADDAYRMKKSATNTFMPVWNIGLFIFENEMNFFNLKIEYSQTFSLKSIKSFNQLYITFGYYIHEF